MDYSVSNWIPDCSLIPCHILVSKFLLLIVLWYTKIPSPSKNHYRIAAYRIRSPVFMVKEDYDGKTEFGQLLVHLADPSYILLLPCRLPGLLIE
jgi:hypothetical protein